MTQGASVIVHCYLHVRGLDWMSIWLRLWARVFVCSMS